MSSSFYILNDVTDAAADRTHPEKCHRPIASGTLPVSIALFGFGMLLLLSFWIAALLDVKVLLLNAFYGGLTLGYCVAFKRVPILDCMVIAAGFVLRVIGGAVAIEVTPTHWLIVCAFLLALYLAFAKRRQELLILSDTATQHRQVRGQYTVDYLDRVNTILISATIVCYALYTIAPETVARLGTNHLIYGTAFVIYGLLRYMALIQNPVNGGDPSKLVLSDRALLIAIVGWTLYNVLCIYRSLILVLWELLRK